MRLVLSGATQNLHTLMVGIDARWPHVNVNRLQLWFPEGTYEAGNAGASCKIGGAGLTTTLVDCEDILAEGDRYYRNSGGDSINQVSLKARWVRGSAASTILIVEAVPA